LRLPRQENAIGRRWRISLKAALIREMLALGRGDR
jgi:hypothetical protein